MTEKPPKKKRIPTDVVGAAAALDAALPDTHVPYMAKGGGAKNLASDEGVSLLPDDYGIGFAEKKTGNVTICGRERTKGEAAAFMRGLARGLKGLGG